VSAHDGYTEEASRPGNPVKHAFRVGTIGAHNRVDQGKRSSSHRADVGDVGDDARGAGGQRIICGERGRDGFRADHKKLVAEGNQRGVVTVADPESTEQRQVTFATQA
jgi:hypothetical protein